ncbi:unnamed protein product [Zymoseptoria tritici ST99CH_3D1]|uniref:Uncharacterized protein n=2 Tax=Zymoseptoria tritici TaxID=1047171 RepID=F9XGT7_ZYMTI|nr:uncharacterized protein MYCGRDRAFT_94710 [Zymoseptoria tritici IPO323]EGP85979.1 hypothetical protein MYCGRDRAFT_94710 [Zymoseptoria tritici IPO323]SMR55605.1 unnamed protein product [Zymoseptoria tritici ST99CH_1E4]SMR57986.1 unnamed protein product [Zymoseptoria tritici ST99CH_3D1]
MAIQWTNERRHALHLLFNDLPNLNDDQAAQVFNRLFGTNATAQYLRSHYDNRHGPRRIDWRAEIDRDDGNYTPAQEATRQDVRADIWIAMVHLGLTAQAGFTDVGTVQFFFNHAVPARVLALGNNLGLLAQQPPPAGPPTYPAPNIHPGQGPPPPSGAGLPVPPPRNLRPR